jgi:glutamine synthetase
MSVRITLSIPDPLAARIEERRGDQNVQDYVLAALRAAVHGSDAELALRAEVARLHATVRALGGAASVPTPSSSATTPTVETDTRKGW